MNIVSLTKFIKQFKIFPLVWILLFFYYTDSSPVMALQSGVSHEKTNNKLSLLPPPPPIKCGKNPPNAFITKIRAESGLNLRTEPTVESLKREVIGYSSSVVVLGSSNDSQWRYIRVLANCQEGWVKAEYVKLPSPETRNIDASKNFWATENVDFCARFVKVNEYSNSDALDLQNVLRRIRSLIAYVEAQGRFLILLGGKESVEHTMEQIRVLAKTFDEISENRIDQLERVTEARIRQTLEGIERQNLFISQKLTEQIIAVCQTRKINP